LQKPRAETRPYFALADGPHAKPAPADTAKFENAEDAPDSFGNDNAQDAQKDLMKFTYAETDKTPTDSEVQ